MEDRYYEYKCFSFHRFFVANKSIASNGYDDKKFRLPILKLPEGFKIASHEFYGFIGL